MKPGFITFIIVAIILSACSASSSTVKKEQKAVNFELIAELIESGSFQFTVRSASPSGGKTIQITSTYKLKANEGIIEAYLPFFGKAYSGTYGDGGSIEFNGTPEDLQIRKNEKRSEVSLTFTIKSDTDNYSVKLSVGSSGYGNLVISSQKRQTISYAGLAGELKD